MQEPVNTHLRSRMITLPHAKINLGLHVLRLRTDGYRDISTVMLPIPLRDALEVIEDPTLRSGETVMTHSGIPVPGDPANDLCLRALRAVAAVRPLPGLRIHLHKVIPTGAGLGGGSSDAAHMISLLNTLFSLGLPDPDMHRMAAAIGSDCAFFLTSGAQLATGRGEVLSPVSVDLTGWWFVLANPGTHVGTAEVYANTPVQLEAVDLAALVSAGPTAWNGRLMNRMEPYVLAAHPEVADLKRQLLAAGATYAAMSGSGSSVFGFFRERPQLEALSTQPLVVSRF